VRRKAFQRRRQTMTAIELHRLLVRLKRTPRYGWLYEVSKCAPQEALRDLDRAYANYWQGRRAGRRVGLPRFKKRGRCPDRFRLRTPRSGLSPPVRRRRETPVEGERWPGRRRLVELPPVKQERARVSALTDA
jgi:putative transposase